MKGDLIPDAIPEPEPPAPYDEILTEWNAMAKIAGIPTCRKLTDGMKAKFRTRWAEADFRDNWQKILRIIPTVPWLCGRNGREWKVDLRYVIRSEDTYNKILDEPDPAASKVCRADDERRADARAARA